jgi:hypothetical protein
MTPARVVRRFNPAYTPCVGKFDSPVGLERRHSASAPAMMGRPSTPPGIGGAAAGRELFLSRVPFAS